MHLLGAIENKTNRSNVNGLTGVDRHPMNNSGSGIIIKSAFLIRQAIMWAVTL